MKARWRFLIASISLLTLWLLVDLAYVLAGQPEASTDVYDYAFFPLGYLAFLWASWPLFPSMDRNVRSGLRALTALFAFAVWLLPAVIVAVQFHVAIGGSL